MILLLAVAHMACSRVMRSRPLVSDFYWIQTPLAYFACELKNSPQRATRNQRFLNSLEPERRVQELFVTAAGTPLLTSASHRVLYIGRLHDAGNSLNGVSLQAVIDMDE